MVDLRTRASLLSCVIAVTLLAACSGSGVADGNGASVDGTALERFIAQADAADLARDPTLRTLKFKSDSEPNWTPESDAFHDETGIILATRIAKLQEAFGNAALPASVRRRYEIYLDQLQNAQLAQKIHRESVTLALNVFDPTWVLPQALRQNHKVNKLQDAQNYVSRLQALPTALDEVLAAAETRKAAGNVLMALNYEELAGQAAALGKGFPCSDDAESPHILLDDLTTKMADAKIAPADAAPILDAAKSALQTAVCPAYAQLAERIEKDFVPHGRMDGIWALPNGKARYRDLVKFNLGADVDPEAIHQLGLSEMERLEVEFRNMMREVSFSGSASEFERYMTSQPTLSIANSPADFEAYLKVSNQALDFVAKRLPDYFLRLPVSPLVTRKTEQGPTGVAGTAATYYSPAPLDGSGPAYYNLGFPQHAPPQGPERVPVPPIYSIAFHEGIPGHHLQQAFAQELQPRVPLVRYYDYMAFIEGWGAYGEQVAYEMGAFQGNQHALIGWKQFQWERALRLVMDTGINYKGWSQQQAVDYLKEKTGAPGRVYRYVMWPGQALGYHYGYLEIIKQRKRAEAALGDAFDIRHFHDVLLRDGQVSMDLMSSAVDQLIADGGRAN